MHTMRKLFRPALLVILALLVVLSLFIPAFGQTAGANDESSGTSSLSLYDRASEVSRVFGTALAPGGGISLAMIQPGGEISAELNAGSAGGFLGYADYMADDTGVTGWFSSAFTQSSDMFTYEQMASIIPGTETEGVFAGKDNPFFHYAGYGEILTEMGLAGTIREGAMANLGRLGATFLTLIAYLLANAAPFLFRIAIVMLDVLNPFKLFFTVFEGMGDTNIGLLTGVANFVGGLYTTIQQFSIYALFPMMLVMTVIGALVFTKTSALKRFARYGLRLFMLFAGLPIIGATYTGIISDLDQEVTTGADYADYLVLSSYVDFENWARNTRLAVPNDSNTQIVNPRATESDSDTAPVPTRDLVLNINGPLAGHANATTLESNYGGNGLGDVFRSERNHKVVTDGPGVHTPKGIGTTIGLLSRHMTGTAYSGSEYAGEVTGYIQTQRSVNLDAADEDAELSETDVALLKMFTLTGSDTRTWSQKITGENSEWAKAVDWDESQGLFTDGAAENEPFQFGEFTYNIYNAGSLQGGSTGVYTSVDVPDMSADDAEALPPIGSSYEVIGGLSPLAMYNFLNTTFTDTGLTIFSPEETVTDTARDSYASVTFASTGVSAFARWVENMAVMLSMALLSISYGGIMIAAAVKNIPRILSGVFGTALGSLAFTAKLLISTLVMLIQILGMILLYYLSEMILMSIIMNMNAFTVQLSNAFGTSGMLIEFARSVITTIVIVLIATFMVKNANVFKEMMEEVVSNGINKFMSLLDTSTGGQGMNTAQTTGGRIGGDGKLTDAAKADSPRDPVAGVGGMMKQAHDLEAQREQMAQENGMGNRGFGSMVASRAKTFGDLAGASAKDTTKRPFTNDPKSYQREVDAKERSVKQAGLKAGGDYATAHGFKGDKETMGERLRSAIKDGPSKAKGGLAAGKTAFGAALGGKMGAAEGTNARGQQIDENGNIKTDKQGNALDANDKAISNRPGLGTTAGAFGAAKVDVDPETGALLDENGDMFADENGNGFYEDENGKLVDANGDFVALDSDGTLQPIASLPDHDGTPVDAVDSAVNLDTMRADADEYAKMQDAHDASHYGMDANGTPIDTAGAPLTYTDDDGNEQPVQFDDEGYLTDAMGNRLDASELNGVTDARGYDIVEDPDTGEQHVQHAGSAAMKEHLSDKALDEDPSSTDDMSLDALSKESTRANALADAAEQNVEQLREQGASPYAITQAEQHAQKARAQATAVDGKLSSAMQDDKRRGATRTPVTGQQVDAANRNADKQQRTLKQEEAKLNQLKSDGASPQAIARQERKVDSQRQATVDADNAAKDAAVANKANRPISEVSEARERVERSEAVLDKALDKQADGIKTGVSDVEMAKRNQAVTKATDLVSQAKSNQARVSEAPQGSAADIDKAAATHEQAKTEHAKAQAKVESLEQKARPMPAQQVDGLRKEQTAAQETMASTRKSAKRHTEAVAAHKAASSDVATHQSTVDRLTKRGASAEKISAAQAKLSTAKSRQADAQQTMSRTRPQAAAFNDARATYERADNTLKQAGRPMTTEESQTVKREQASAQSAMVQHKPVFDKYTRAQSSFKQAKRAANASKRDVERLTKQKAPATEIQAAKEKHERARQKVDQAASAKRQYSPGAQNYKQAERTHEQATRRLDSAQPTVSERDITAARQAERRAAANVKRTSKRRHQVSSPKGWTEPNRSAASARVPETSNDKGYTNLVSEGVRNYDDYREKATGYKTNIQDSKRRIQQAKEQAKQMKQSKRPASEIRTVESQIQGLQRESKANEGKLETLQTNAHGLLRRMAFDVPGVTTGNTARSGAVLANQVETMGHVTQMRDGYQQKRDAGTATAADNKRYAKLNGQLKEMRRTLAEAGINEAALQDEQSMKQATTAIRNRWDGFVDGNPESLATGQGPSKRTARQFNGGTTGRRRKS